MSPPDRVRVVVGGDSGVGKTSLTSVIAHSQSLSSPSWTVGCSVEVKLHQYLEGTPAEKEFFVELWDIGGSHSQRNTRQVFMHTVHGIILVHDLNNRKSSHNLDKWLCEVTKGEPGAWDGGTSEVGEVTVPLLVVGTKLDEANGSRLPLHARRSHIAEEFGTEEIHLNCNDKTSIAPGTSAATKLTRFFDKVSEILLSLSIYLYSLSVTPTLGYLRVQFLLLCLQDCEVPLLFLLQTLEEPDVRFQFLTPHSPTTLLVKIHPQLI